jgi:hypothetical protein
MMMDERQDRIRASYRDNYNRLAQIKRGEPLPHQPEHRAFQRLREDCNEAAKTCSSALIIWS